MAKHFNFTRLINKYSANFTLTAPGDGNYVGGQWESEGKTEITMRGAIVPVTAGNANTGDMQMYHPGGAYIEGARRLFMVQPITQPLDGAEVKYKGVSYHIEQDVDFRDYADVYIYLLKRVDLLDTNQKT